MRAIQEILLTKAIHKAKRQMDDRDVDSLNKTLHHLSALSDDIDHAQDSYVSTLEDSDKIEAAAVDILNLTDSLDSAALILKKHGKNTEVDTQNFILKICMKLLPQLRNKWREKATTHLADKDSYQTFQDIVDFIERHAHIYNDPIYGGDALQEPDRRSVATKN